MKRLIFASHVPDNRTIDIILNFERIVFTSDVAAKTYIHHPTSVKKSTRISDWEMGRFNDFIESVYDMLDSKGFILHESEDYQSKKSYSYYLHFEWVHDDGTHDMWRFRFRIANHENKGMRRADNSQRIRKDQEYLRSIVISDRGEFENGWDALTAINKMLDGIKSGTLKWVEFNYKGYTAEEIDKLE